jgi:hypothetical protein
MVNSVLKAETDTLKALLLRINIAGHYRAGDAPDDPDDRIPAALIFEKIMSHVIDCWTDNVEVTVKLMPPNGVQWTALVCVGNESVTVASMDVGDPMVPESVSHVWMDRDCIKAIKAMASDVGTDSPE